MLVFVIRSDPVCNDNNVPVYQTSLEGLSRVLDNQGESCQSMLRFDLLVFDVDEIVSKHSEQWKADHRQRQRPV